MFAIIIIIGLVLAAVAVMSLTVWIGQKINNNFLISSQAFYAAESGIEDSLFRLVKGKSYQAANVLTVGSSTANISITTNGNKKTVRVEGEKQNRFRNLETVMDVTTDDISFYYGVQVGEGGLSMSNNSRVTGSIYSNGPILGSAGAVVTGDVFVASAAGSINQEWTAAGSDFIFGRQGNEIDAAQSFVLSASEKLTKVSLYLKKFGNPGDRTIRILTDNGDKPSKTLAGSGAYGTLIASQISQTTYGWIDVVMETPPNLSAGTKYWIVIDAAQNSSNYFFWGKDPTDGYAPGTAKCSPNWSAGSPAWYNINGDLAFKAWLGGAINSLETLQVGGHAHANTIQDSTITGDAYFQTIVNTTVGGTQYPSSPDPSMEAMPISDSNIADWKTDAESGGVIIGDYNLTNYASGSLGPKKIVGNMNISNGAQLTITGTVYVTGTINISNNAIIRLSPSYGENSGIILTDDFISVSNNVVFSTSAAGSYIMMLSAKSGDAINISNNANTVIFYASAGNVTIANNANLKEVTAYKITLSNNAQVNYESGLASAKFSSGAGAGWQVTSWREVP